MEHLLSILQFCTRDFWTFIAVFFLLAAFRPLSLVTFWKSTDKSDD